MRGWWAAVRALGCTPGEVRAWRVPSRTGTCRDSGAHRRPLSAVGRKTGERELGDKKERPFSFRWGIMEAMSTWGTRRD